MVSHPSATFAAASRPANGRLGSLAGATRLICAELKELTLCRFSDCARIFPERNERSAAFLGPSAIKGPPPRSSVCLQCHHARADTAESPLGPEHGEQGGCEGGIWVGIMPIAMVPRA